MRTWSGLLRTFLQVADAKVVDIDFSADVA